MEDHNNKKKNKYPSIPSNFVTLVQLQEKWIKEQQRKQNEKEKQEEEKQQQQQQLKPIHRKNRNTVEKAVVAVENANESAVKEVNSEESSSPSKKKKKKKRQWRGQNKEENESRAEGVKEGETHAPPPESRVWEKKVMRSEYRAKSNNNAVVVVVQSEGLQSESVVEIEPKFGDLSMNSESGECKNDGAVRANGNFNRRESRGGYGSYREMRRGPRSGEGKNDGAVRANSNFNRRESRGGYGSYREMRREPRSGPGVVWVKKVEVVDANVDGIIAPVAQ